MERVLSAHRSAVAVAPQPRELKAAASVERAIHSYKHWNHQADVPWICRIGANGPEKMFVDRSFKRAEGALNMVGLGFGRGAQMPTAEQCRAYAAEHKLLGGDPRSSARRCAV